MPSLIALEDEAVSDLEECADALSARGFDPSEQESLQHAARCLRRLGNNRQFLGDLVAAELAEGPRLEEAGNPYGPQVIMLSRPEKADFLLRANIWPGQADHALRASGAGVFAYGLAHDHNFSFLTLGYFGPGYWSKHYEFDYDAVEGWSGEPVELRFIERSRLEQGRIELYRAHRDVHEQEPPETLSVSLNVVQTGGVQGWLDQYAFDTSLGRVQRILSSGSSEAFIHIAVALGSEEALGLAEHFAGTHPSDRMRLACWEALAALTADPVERDGLWRRAERSGSRLVAGEARLRRAALTPG